MSLHDLRGRAAVGARHQDARHGAHHAAVAHRAERRHPAVQGRSVAERRGDRDDRRRGPTPARRAAIPRTCRRRRSSPNDEEWHIGTPDLIVEIPKDHVVPANARRPVDRLHRRFRADRGPLSQGGRGQARARRPRRRPSPADLSDSGSGRRRSAVGPARRSRHQQRELPQRVRRRQERRHPARRAPPSW